MNSACEPTDARTVTIPVRHLSVESVMISIWIINEAIGEDISQILAQKLVDFKFNSYIIS
jgi:hypothetical protein